MIVEYSCLRRGLNWMPKKRKKEKSTVSCCWQIVLAQYERASQTRTASGDFLMKMRKAGRKKNLTAFNLAFSSQVLFLSPYTAHRAMSMWETTVMLSVFKPSVSSTTKQGFVCVFRRDYSPSLGPSFYPFCRIPAGVPPHHCLSIPQWTSQ